MARVTVEDCVDKVPNRFELILIATYRARALANGALITVQPDNDKNPVIALREIAEKTISPGDMREGLIASIQMNPSRAACLRCLGEIQQTMRSAIQSPKWHCYAAWRDFCRRKHPRATPYLVELPAASIESFRSRSAIIRG